MAASRLKCFSFQSCLTSTIALVQEINGDEEKITPVAISATYLVVLESLRRGLNYPNAMTVITKAYGPSRRLPLQSLNQTVDQVLAPLLLLSGRRGIGRDSSRIVFPKKIPDEAYVEAYLSVLDTITTSRPTVFPTDIPSERVADLEEKSAALDEQLTTLGERAPRTWRVTRRAADAFQRTSSRVENARLRLRDALGLLAVAGVGISGVLQNTILEQAAAPAVLAAGAYGAALLARKAGASVVQWTAQRAFDRASIA